VLAALLSPHILRSFVSTPVTWLSCGFEHCLALTVFGTAASWGYGASGCLGQGNYVSYTSPKLIQCPEIKDSFLVYVEAGGYHNAAVASSGDLFMWGRADVGQVGLPKSEMEEDEMGYVVLQPKRITFFSGEY